MARQYVRSLDEHYFAWQYFACPQPTVLIVASHDQAIAGMFGFRRRPLTNGLIAGQAIDLLVAPEWRGSGLFPQLARAAMACFADLDLACVLPNPAGRYAVERALNWRTLGTVPLWTLGPDSLQRAPTLRRSGASQGRVRFAYDAATVRWRFDAHPHHHYSAPSADGQRLFVKVFRDPRTGDCWGDLVRVEPTDSGQIAPGVLDAALTVLREQKVSGISTWALRGTSLAGALAARGFEERAQERYFCVRSLSSRAAELDDLTAWELEPADAEFY